MKKFYYALIIVCTFALVSGCGSGSEELHKEPGVENGSTAEAVGDVAPELGGPGFEAMAGDLGFQTYKAAPEDMKLYGDSRAKTGGEFRYIITRFPLNFRPLGYGKGAQYAENLYISSLLYEPLLSINHATLEYEPSLATHWKISADRSTYTFRLDPNARFSNGEPVTARDVIATWNVLVNPDTEMPITREDFIRYEEPVALSPYIVEVKATERTWDSFMKFASQMVILPHSAVGQLSGREFLDTYQFDVIPGSGEYTIKSTDIVKQQSYVFTRRDDYWRKDYPESRYQGNFDRIRLEVVKDNENLEYEKFKKGEQDIFYYTSSTMEQWVNDNDYPAMQKGWVLKKRIHTQGPSSQWGIAINMRRPPFDDVRVRKALCHLLNRKAFIEKALYNEYKPLDSFFGNSPYENPNNPKVRFDPELAKKLLAEAGWTKRNKRGILMKDGQEFVITFAIPKAVERFVTPFQAELKRVGIDLELKFEDSNALFEKAMERNFTLNWSTLSGAVFPSPRSTVHSEMDRPDTWNLEGIRNARIDAIVDEYDTTFSQRKREVLLRELDSLRMETYSRILLYDPQGIKISHWNKFGIPPFHFERVARTGDFPVSIFRYWWHDEAKARKLEEAMKTDGVLAPYEGIQDVRYWQSFANKTM